MTTDAGCSCNEDFVALDFRQDGPLPADYSDLVHQQNGDCRQRDPGRRRITPEEVERHSRPAGASCDQSAADIECSHSCREICTVDMPEPEEFAQCPNNDKKLGCDSYLSPAFFGHGKIVPVPLEFFDDWKNAQLIY